MDNKKEIYSQDLISPFQSWVPLKGISKFISMYHVYFHPFIPRWINRQSFLLWLMICNFILHPLQASIYYLGLKWISFKFTLKIPLVGPQRRDQNIGLKVIYLNPIPENFQLIPENLWLDLYILGVRDERKA